MKNLLATLNDYDPGMLPALAQVWAVDSKGLTTDELLRALQNAMLEPARAEAAWDKLDDSARAALQLLASSALGRMKSGQFERVYGSIRKLGQAQIQRHAPHQRGESIAETLYYRGFIGEGFDKVDGRLIAFVYLPSDLSGILPWRKTSYDALDAGESAAAAPATLDVIEEVDDISRADTAIVDDMTSLLARLQASPAALEGSQFAAAAQSAIAPLLLRPQAERLAFLLGLGQSAALIALRDGRAEPNREAARAWLGQTRLEQVRALAAAWRGSQTWRDMWHVPGLYPEDSGWSYDAAAARETVLGLLGDLLPAAGWISLTELIGTIKEFEPDFQRLDGDFDSWYIRNDSGEYLTGFDSWDAVEGALIEYYLLGPMHWLGLADTGEDVLRLTAFGRAFLGISDWPQVAEPAAAISVADDGSLLASRRVSRFERFQLARFARCAEAGDPYVYVIDGDAIGRAAAQGISPRQIQAFLARHTGGAQLPLGLTQLLRNWRAGVKAAVSLESLMVLRATDDAAMDKIFAEPALRRYLGARLGPLACIVQPEHWQALRARLSAEAIEVDISRLRE